MQISKKFKRAVISLSQVRCAIWYHLYNLKNVNNTHGGMLLLVKLQAEVNRATRQKCVYQKYLYRSITS